MNKKYFYMNSAELMDSVFDILKKSFWYQVIFSLLVTIAATVMLFIMILIFAMIMGAFSYGGISLFLTIVITLVVIIFVLLFLSILSAGKISISKEAYCTEHINFNKATKNAFSSAIRFRVVSVLFFKYLGYIIIMAAFYFLLLFYVDLSGMNIYFIEPLAQAMVLRHLIPIFIIGLIAIAALAYFNAIFIAAVPISVFENKMGISAMIKSYRLVRSDLKKITLLTILWPLILVMLSYSLFLLSAILLIVAQMYFDFDTLTVMSIAVTLFYFFSFGLRIVLAPFSEIMTTVIYINQKIKHEGIDVEIGLEQLTKRNEEAEKKKKYDLLLENRKKLIKGDV